MEPAKEQSQETKEKPAETKDTESKNIVIGASIENIDSQFWIANVDAMRKQADKLGVKWVEVVAQGDINKQLQQVEDLVAQKVDAIICIPKDGKAIVSAIKKANEAGIPFITNNRAAAEGADVALDVASDSYTMAKTEAQWLVDQAKKNNMKYKALVFVGDLKDVNAAYRDKGFTEIAEANKDYIEIVTKVPTEWKPELAMAGTVNALRANNDINCIFTPSDFLLPAIVSGMKQSNKWFKYNESGHITLATFDGAEDALDLIKDGYVDICMVQDSIETGIACVNAAVKLAKGEKLESNKMMLPGFAVTRENFEEKAYDAWGYVDKKK